MIRKRILGRGVHPRAGNLFQHCLELSFDVPDKYRRRCVNRRIQ